MFVRVCVCIWMVGTVVLWVSCSSSPEGNRAAIDAEDQLTDGQVGTPDAGSSTDAEATLSDLQSTETGTPEPDTKPPDVDGGESDPDTVPVDADSEPDTSEPDTSEPDTSEPDVAEPDEGTLPPLPSKKYEVADGCAIPLDFVSSGCASTECADDYQCLGNGFCVPSGPFLIEPDPVVYQSKISLAPGQNGRFAASWYHYYNKGNDKVMDAAFRIYEADGTPATELVKVDEDTYAWARSPSITQMSNGGFLVTWRGQVGIGGDVGYMARVIDPQGTPKGPAIQLNQTPLTKEVAAISNVDGPFARLLRNGTLGVAWMGRPKGTNNTHVYLRVLGENGQPITDELDTGAQTPAQETSPVITDSGNGGVAIYWQHGVVEAGENGKTKPVGHIIKGRLFDQFAQPQGDVFQLSPGVEPSENMPSAASFKNGDFFVTYKTRKTPFATTQTSIWGLKTNAQGIDVGNKVHHFGDDPLGHYPFYAPVAAIDADRAAIVWHTIHPGMDGVYMRRYYSPEDIIDCEITKVSEPDLPNEGGGRHLPAVIGFEDGRLLVGWQSAFGGKSKAVLRYLK